MFKAIFWDNDGVLVQTEQLYFDAAKEILDPLGITISMEWYMAENLKKSTSVFQLAKERGYSEEEISKFRKKRNALYAAMLRKHVPLSDGIKEVLDTLKGRLIMGVVSNSLKEHFDIILLKSGLKNYFSFFITNDDVSKGKPDPEGYLLALKQTGLHPADCLVIEDTERGVVAAKAAGLTCFAVPHELSKNHDFSLADRVLGDIRELPGLILPA